MHLSHSIIKFSMIYLYIRHLYALYIQNKGEIYMETLRNINMDSAISTAAYVIEMFYSDDLNFENWFNDFDIKETALKKWKKPNKITLVHEYIETLYLEDQNYTLSKHFPVPVITELQLLLNYYQIDYSIVGHIDVSKLDHNNCSNKLEKYAEDLQSFFVYNLLDIVVNDVFSILYMDKDFMHSFNLQCSKIIKRLKVKDHPDLLKKDGVLKRITYYPQWLKSGIKYRDKCRCSICGCDLSSAFTTIVDKNFDHIIPLAEGGNNDPSNWQLLCESCNKTKGARNTAYKNIVFPFWKIDQ